MTRPLGLLLALLGAVLLLGMVGIVAAAVRESRLAPGISPSPARRRKALTAAAVAFVLIAGLVVLGGQWWHVEAAGYARALYRPLHLSPTLTGNLLDLKIASEIDPDPNNHHSSRLRSNADLLPDHGHLMHLYAIRQPGMDAVFHLHPTQTAPGDLRMTLPSMPPGTYKLYGDIVHANGFPETLTATLTVPPDMPPAALAPDDAAATPPPLADGRPRPRLQASRRLHAGLGSPREPHRQHRLRPPLPSPRPIRPTRHRHAALPRHGRPRRLRQGRRQHLRPHPPQRLRRDARRDARQRSLSRRSNGSRLQ